MDTKSTGAFKALLDDKTYLAIPKVNDLVKGRIVSVAKNEVRIDIFGYRTGVVRGRELADPSRQYDDVKIGEEVEATVIDLENELGEMELSFRFAGHRKAWDNLLEIFKIGDPISAKITEASKGGLIVKLGNVSGFLPVSQLSPENYPRVAGGDKAKILEKLKTFVGKNFDVKIIDVNEQDEKLIVSEKIVWEERQKNVISKYKIGDVVEGDVSAIADFGVFVKFDILEGLVHISEIAWQRIDHPKDVLKLGDHVKAEIIGIEGSKIFLSMKKLTTDPWKEAAEKYKIGQVVKGKVIKINPFGFFVELDNDIHGLAHVSEIPKVSGKDIDTLAKPGDIMDFMIVSVEADQHRMGLSIKALTEPKVTKEPEATSEDSTAKTNE